MNGNFYMAHKNKPLPVHSTRCTRCIHAGFHKIQLPKPFIPIKYETKLTPFCLGIYKNGPSSSSSSLLCSHSLHQLQQQQQLQQHRLDRLFFFFLVFFCCSERKEVLSTLVQIWQQQTIFTAPLLSLFHQ